MDLYNMILRLINFKAPLYLYRNQTGGLFQEVFFIVGKVQKDLF